MGHLWCHWIIFIYPTWIGMFGSGVSSEKIQLPPDLQEYLPMCIVFLLLHTITHKYFSRQKILLAGRRSHQGIKIWCTPMSYSMINDIVLNLWYTLSSDMFFDKDWCSDDTYIWSLIALLTQYIRAPLVCGLMKVPFCCCGFTKSKYCHLDLCIF